MGWQRPAGTRGADHRPAVVRGYLPVTSPTFKMPNESSSNRLLLSLVHLRSNTLVAENLSGGTVVTKAEIERLGAIAAGIFGFSLDKIECVPCEGPPLRLEVTVDVLEVFLPAEQASDEYQFLMELEARVHSWLTSEVP
jgi:hypothetical protein